MLQTLFWESGIEFTKQFIYYVACLLWSLTQLCKFGNTHFIIPILQGEKPRLSETRWLVWGYTCGRPGVKSLDFWAMSSTPQLHLCII